MYRRRRGDSELCLLGRQLTDHRMPIVSLGTINVGGGIVGSWEGTDIQTALDGGPQIPCDVALW